MTHGFFYLLINNLKTGEIIIELKDLTCQGPHLKLDFLKILSDFGISYNSMEIGKGTVTFQIKPDDSNTNLTYYFTKGKKIILLAVAESFNEDLASIMETFVDDFDQNVILEKLPENHIKNLTKNFTKKLENIIIELLDHYFFDFLFPYFLIPEKNDEIPENIVKKIIEKFDIPAKFFKKIDGSWSIEDFYDDEEYKSEKIKKYLLILSLYGLIYFRTYYHNWDIFLCNNSNIKEFLKDGTKKNLSLINKFQSHKIINLLQYINKNELNFLELKNNFNITRVKLRKYISELINRELIQRKKIQPNIRHISDDIIPLLAMQDFNRDDFKTLNKIENFISTGKDVHEIALEISIDPSQIKVLIEKYNNAINLLN